VEDEGIAEMLTTPEGIRTLQRKLYRKAKQEPACRFHALYDKVYQADILSHAYNLVRANKGSAGIDGVPFEDIEAGEGAVASVAELGEALSSKTYKPAPVKRVMIPKGMRFTGPPHAPQRESYTIIVASALMTIATHRAESATTDLSGRIIWTTWSGNTCSNYLRTQS
jgi:hypothetical protein